MTTTFGHAFQPVGPGPKNSGPGPEVRVRGPQKVPGPDLDRTLDSLIIMICDNYKTTIKELKLAGLAMHL